MPEPLRPAAAKLFGRQNRIIVPAIASITLAPTVAEITGVSTLDITRMLFGDSDEPSMTTDAAEEDLRWGDTESYEFIGQTKYTFGMLTYPFGPQAVAGTVQKQLFEKIPAGFTGFCVDRLAVPRATTPVAGQFVNVYPIECGPSFITKKGDGASQQGAATCRVAITGPIAQGIAILA